MVEKELFNSFREHFGDASHSLGFDDNTVTSFVETMFRAYLNDPERFRKRFVAEVEDE